MAHGQPAHEQHHFGHHSVRLEQGRHVAHLNNDVDVTVAEDEPPKGAVEDDIASIEAKPESSIKRYFDKWTGGIDQSLPFPTLQDCAVSWVGAFIGILVVSVTDHFLWRDHGFRVLVASFGASAVLLYVVPESKLSQPRNLVGEDCIGSQPSSFSLLQSPIYAAQA
eukprot:GHRR01030035.1.p1 GENE.GHRR01030035.1~~GHRR01030035.1.p1  ORF type:complete len:166 (+),score=20.42 GHRR01030035.1:227-724(+)